MVSTFGGRPAPPRIQSNGGVRHGIPGCRPVVNSQLDAQQMWGTYSPTPYPDRSTHLQAHAAGERILPARPTERTGRTRLCREPRLMFTRHRSQTGAADEQPTRPAAVPAGQWTAENNAPYSPSRRRSAQHVCWAGRKRSRRAATRVAGQPDRAVASAASGDGRAGAWACRRTPLIRTAISMRAALYIPRPHPGASSTPSSSFPFSESPFVGAQSFLS